MRVIKKVDFYFADGETSTYKLGDEIFVGFIEDEYSRNKSRYEIITDIVEVKNELGKIEIDIYLNKEIYMKYSGVPYVVYYR